MTERIESRRLLNAEEVAAVLGVPTSTLTYWRHLSKGPRFIRVGRNVRYCQADIDDFIASREAGGGN